MIDLSKPLPEYVVLLAGFSNTPPTGTVLSIKEKPGDNKDKYTGWGSFKTVKAAVIKYPEYFVEFGGTNPEESLAFIKRIEVELGL